MGVGPWKVVQCAFCGEKVPKWMLEAHIKGKHGG